MSDTSHLSIDDFLDEKRIVSHFQPLISIRRKGILGYEALSRGIMPGSREIVSPAVLYGLVEDHETMIALERFTRDLAFKSFLPLYRRNNELMLSINVDASVIDHVQGPTSFLRYQLERWGIPPGNIILEINESKAEDVGALYRFVKLYREQGFLIALDDMGAGHSNLDRIFQLKPDIIKIDRSLSEDIHQQYYKQSIAGCLANMADKIGAAVLAEGIEKEEDALTLLKLGVDLFQGFLFGRPAPPVAGASDTRHSIGRVAELFAEQVVDNISGKREQYGAYHAVVDEMLQFLVSPGRNGVESRMRECIDRHAELECLYILDETGRQISHTILDSSRIRKKALVLSMPCIKGDDHSLKEYFLPLRADLKRFTTDPYISRATGNSCVTISVKFECSGVKSILCADFTHFALN